MKLKEANSCAVVASTGYWGLGYFDIHYRRMALADAEKLILICVGL